MYKLKDIVTELLEGTAIKKIARVRKVSENTIKRYRGLLDTILKLQPAIENDIDAVMDQFKQLRKQQRYSDNFGWLEANDELINKLSLQCNRI